MKNIRLSNFCRVRSAAGSRLRKILLLTGLGAAGIALATPPPLGFIVNQILAKGTITSNINENVQITPGSGRNSQSLGSRSTSPWGDRFLHAASCASARRI